MLSETEEGKVSEEWVGNCQFLALRFCHGRLNGSAFNNLAGALHTDRVVCTLSVGGEVKMEIPVIMTYDVTVAPRAGAWIEPRRPLNARQSDASRAPRYANLTSMH